MDVGKLKTLLDEYDAGMLGIGGCSDGYCVVVKPKGMHTNGGCHCHNDHNKARRAMARGHFLRVRIQKLLDTGGIT